MLETHGLGFGYTKHHRLFENWSAQFPAGATTAITGASGRGKSTLLYLLGLMLRPAQGAVALDGIDTSSLRDAERARLRAEQFGFVFQDAALDQTRSVLDNVTEVALYRGESRAGTRTRAMELLDRFGVGVSPERKPGQVSGGQAQRIALCRALLMRPRIVLADEPTGNLDADSASVVQGALASAARAGATVVIVTHSTEVASSCDRQIRL